MTTPSRPPLWREMCRAMAEVDMGANASEIYAAEIRALRDWLFSAGRPGDDSCCDVMQACLWDQLTTEADRAERGDV